MHTAHICLSVCLSAWLLVDGRISVNQASEHCQLTDRVNKTGGSWAAETSWQRSAGPEVPAASSPPPLCCTGDMDKLMLGACDFDDAGRPASMTDMLASTEKILQRADRLR